MTLSKYYRIYVYVVLGIGVLNVFMSNLLIAQYGIFGAAYAVMICMVLFNTIKGAFLWLKFGLSPFTTANVKLMLLILLILITCVQYFQTESYIYSALKSIVITILYVVSVILLKFSPDMNALILSSINKLFK